MSIMKKLVGGLLLAGAMSSLTIPVFAYTPAQPKPGFVMDYSVYNVATYEGNSGTSGVSLFSVSRGKKMRRPISHGREVTGTGKSIIGRGTHIRK